MTITAQRRAVLNAEHSLKRGRPLGPPKSLGLRVIARTCPACGDLMTTPPHLLRVESGRIPNCQRCIRQWQEEPLPTADHKGQQWTGPELEIAARSDLTALQVAQMLGRTFFAVKTVRGRLRHDPRLSRMAGAA